MIKKSTFKITIYSTIIMILFSAGAYRYGIKSGYGVGYEQGALDVEMQFRTEMCETPSTEKRSFIFNSDETKVPYVCFSVKDLKPKKKLKTKDKPNIKNSA